MKSDKPKFESGFDPSKVSALDIFKAQPQIQFRLPEGPHEVIEDPLGLVHVFAQGREHPILTMPRSVADQLGWTEAGSPVPSKREPPEPPKSGARVSSRSPRRA